MQRIHQLSGWLERRRVSTSVQIMLLVALLLIAAFGSVAAWNASLAKGKKAQVDPPPIARSA